ncbi:hypothetical protein SAMN05216368_105114 [Cryobacterium flavum]|uniref:Uncharacterized protein n=1 Tax=Cryobacterium flavum TaxID=1424659 RepID=A0A4R8V3A4_9MICO|nr:MULTISPECIES: hypothetical protein [Cryobacterium]TFB77123.1 hypothetical protein E3O21_09510 [Cryobacterium flavum]SDN38865.1 hypothetical protein SAMN05216368_105114 [Cryobacterium flavum]
MPRIVLTWHYPTTGYAAANARYYKSNTGFGGLIEVSLGSGVSTSEPVSGTFTSTFEGALLGGLLGGAGDVGVAAAHSSGLAHLERARHVPAAGRRRNLHDRERLTHYR